MVRKKEPERISRQLIRLLQLIDLTAQWRMPFTPQQLHREWQREFGETVNQRTVIRDCQLLCYVGLFNVARAARPSANGFGTSAAMYRHNLSATVPAQHAALAIVERRTG